MPKGPQGQKRPADVIGAAVIVAKIAAGEIEEKLSESSGPTAAEIGLSGLSWVGLCCAVNSGEFQN